MTDILLPNPILIAMSIEYLNHRHSTSLLLSQYFSLLRASEQSQSADSHAALTIQRYWRGYRDRKYLSHLHNCAIQIQCLYRGYIGRRVFQIKQSQYSHELFHKFYVSMATYIQAHIRGYYLRSRYYRDEKIDSNCKKYDYYRRKDYLQLITEQTFELEKQTNKHLIEQIKYEEKINEMKSKKDFTHLTQNIHHLISTKSIPGVFQSPNITTAFNQPLEHHIQNTFQQAIKNNNITKENTDNRKIKNKNKTTQSQTKRKEKKHKSMTETSKSAIQANSPTARPVSAKNSIKSPRRISIIDAIAMATTIRRNDNQLPDIITPKDNSSEQFSSIEYSHPASSSSLDQTIKSSFRTSPFRSAAGEIVKNDINSKQFQQAQQKQQQQAARG